MRRFLLRGAALAVLPAALAGCGGSTPRYAAAPAPTPPAAAAFTDIGYSNWSDAEPAYRFYPGDEIDISSTADASLNRTVTVGPDGRISMPWISPVMVSGRTIDDVRAALGAAYQAAGMRNPRFDVGVKTASAVDVYIGGEVGAPGEVALTGDMNALQAIVKAGSFKTTARSGKVVIIRRGVDGQMAQKVVDLSPANVSGKDLVPLRRGDIVFVPKTSVAELGAFMSQVRDTLPIQFGYNLNGY